MERDFMGLGVKVKHEIPEEISNSAGKGSTLPWLVSKKVEESIPEIICFDPPNEENHKNLILSTTPLSPPLTSPFQAKNNSNDMVDFTQIRNSYVATCAPAQLTIFYRGSVCVFDEVSFEKAQAIMLLAGNGSLSSPSSVLQSPVQTPAIQTPYIADSSVANLSHNSKFSFSNPISPASTSNQLSAGNIGALRSPSRKTVNSLGSFTANVISYGSVPQFRKASLARFLEKRKERVMNALPYSSGMNSSGCLPLPASS